MDARGSRLVTMIVSLICLSVTPAMAATYRTKNFTVSAPSKEFAEEVGKAAEFYREKLAVDWLGKPLPGNWSNPCPITVRVGQLGAGGATSFQFDRGEVFGWRMNIQGTEERILDSVLPHEVSHMIFASYFRRPLPRWADEGAATLIEHESERRRQQLLLDEVMDDGSRFPLRTLLSMKEYPQDHRRVLTLYAQGYSLADYLIQKQGRQTFLKFLNDAHNQNWDTAIRTHYKMKNTASLESKWNNWIMAGSPRLSVPEGELLADNNESTERTPVVRAQNPEASKETITASLGDSVSETDAPLFGSDETASDDLPVIEIPETVPESIEDTIDSIAVAAETDRSDSVESRGSPEEPSDLGLREYQIRGRRAVVLAGWKPASSTTPRVNSRDRRTDPRSERPRVPGNPESANQERPPFVNDSKFAMSN